MTLSQYYFEFPDRENDFYYLLEDDPAEMLARADQPRIPPDWTRLNCHRCAHCPLTEQDTGYCPPALNMVSIVERFAECDSFKTVTFYISNGPQKHSTVTDLQTALAYLFPFVLMKSACPYAPLLRPMAKFMKPFPDLEDIFFYLLSFDLVKKHLNNDDEVSASHAAHCPDKDSYNIVMALHGLLNRLREASRNDANINGIIKDIQWSYCMLNSKNIFVNCLKPYFSG